MRTFHRARRAEDCPRHPEAIESQPETERPETPHERLLRLIATDRCVILDGAIGTELIEVGGQRPEADEHLWGVTAILDAPAEVKAVHRRYVDVGCDVISTNTWGLPTALRDGSPQLGEGSEPVHWMDVARRAVQLARGAAAEAGVATRSRSRSASTATSTPPTAARRSDCWRERSRRSRPT